MTKKLDKEHLEAIQELQEKFANNARYLGSIAIELKMIEQQQRTLLDTQQSVYTDFENLRKEETQLIDALKERYGDGQINIADGTFTSAE